MPPAQRTCPVTKAEFFSSATPTTISLTAPPKVPLGKGFGWSKAGGSKAMLVGSTSVVVSGPTLNAFVVDSQNAAKQPMSAAAFSALAKDKPFQVECMPCTLRPPSREIQKSTATPAAPNAARATPKSAADVFAVLSADEFSTGSLGWEGHARVPVRLGSASLMLQVNVNCPILHSKSAAAEVATVPRNATPQVRRILSQVGTATAAEADELKKITGIGPFIEKARAPLLALTHCPHPSRTRIAHATSPFFVCLRCRPPAALPPRLLPHSGCTASGSTPSAKSPR
jgi:hypothetical protein